VTVRILSPFNEPELRFSLREKYEGIEALISAPQGASIKNQLAELKKRYPNESTDKLSERVIMRNWALTDKQCPQLKRIIYNFKVLKMSPVVEDDLHMDQTEYEFWSQALWGNKLAISLGGEGYTSLKYSHPLVAWAESTRRTLQRRCNVNFR
jgi:hypothetical protein